MPRRITNHLGTKVIDLPRNTAVNTHNLPPKQRKMKLKQLCVAPCRWRWNTQPTVFPLCYPLQVEMVYSLLSMLGTHDKDDMSRTLLAMSSSQDSCIAMRQSGCLPLLIQLLHGNDKDSLLLGNHIFSQHVTGSLFTTAVCICLVAHLTSCLCVFVQVTHAAAKRLAHERQQHCTTSFTVSRMTKEADVRSECSTCWSRCGITVRPVGAGKRTTRGVSTRRTTPVSDEPNSLIMLLFIVRSYTLYIRSGAGHL